jgi:hypothetical protein
MRTSIRPPFALGTAGLDFMRKLDILRPPRTAVTSLYRVRSSGTADPRAPILFFRNR